MHVTSKAYFYFVYTDVTNLLKPLSRLRMSWRTDHMSIWDYILNSCLTMITTNITGSKTMTVPSSRLYNWLQFFWTDPNSSQYYWLMYNVLMLWSFYWVSLNAVERYTHNWQYRYMENMKLYTSPLAPNPLLRQETGAFWTCWCAQFVWGFDSLEVLSCLEHSLQQQWITNMNTQTQQHNDKSQHDYLQPN